MRSWLLQFVRVWMWLFVPSCCLWLLMVRWNDGGVDRFEATWRWFEDLLAFPLAFQPITDPSWTALHGDNALGAVLGFVVLVAVWAAMFAVPVAFVSGWLQLLTRRQTAEPVGRATIEEFGVDAKATPRRASSNAPPLILVVTLPLALLYQGFLALKRIKLGRLLRAFVPAIIIFALTIFVMMAIIWVTYSLTANTDAWEWYETYGNLGTHFWFGYLDTLRVPRIFEEQFWSAFYAQDVRDRHGLRWIADPNLQTMAIVIAVRTALIPTIPVAIWGLVRFVRTRPKGTTT